MVNVLQDDPDDLDDGNDKGPKGNRPKVISVGKKIIKY